MIHWSTLATTGTNGDVLEQLDDQRTKSAIGQDGTTWKPVVCLRFYQHTLRINMPFAEMKKTCLTRDPNPRLFALESSPSPLVRPVNTRLERAMKWKVIRCQPSCLFHLSVSMVQRTRVITLLKIVIEPRNLFSITSEK